MEKLHHADPEINKRLVEFGKNTDFEHDIKCDYCIDVNCIPDEGEVCIFSDKKCSRYEKSRIIHGEENMWRGLKH